MKKNWISTGSNQPTSHAYQKKLDFHKSTTELPLNRWQKYLYGQLSLKEKHEKKNTEKRSRSHNNNKNQLCHKSQKETKNPEDNKNNKNEILKLVEMCPPVNSINS